MKILALDLGDRWVGSALSDPMKITCKPYQTVELSQLSEFLQQTLQKEPITTVVVGYPKTFAGGQSAQTEKIVQQKQALELQFATVAGRDISWILWDERLSSKRAACGMAKGDFSPDAKKKSHSVAAAFILQSYLDNLAFERVNS